MSGIMARTADNAKTVTTYSCGNRPRALRLNAALMRKSRDLFSVKTAFHLSDITGYSVRACENWLSEKVVIPSDALALLLHSEWGREFLAAVMSDNTPRWWKQLSAWIGAIDLALAEKKLRRKRKELLDELEYAPATSFAEVLHDPEFNRAQVIPVRRVHRAMVLGKVK
jgi:hypothetical protein